MDGQFDYYMPLANLSDWGMEMSCITLVGWIGFHALNWYLE